MADCWHKNYEGAPTNGSTWTTGCDDSKWTFMRGRVIGRGGSWDSHPQYLRSANRSSDAPSIRSSDGGFRLVQDINP